MLFRCSRKIRADVQSVRQREEFSSGCSSGGFGLGRMFLNGLFDSLTPGVPVVSTAGASSLKSSAWYGVVFITLSMGLMAVFASHQAHANQVCEYLHADKVYEYFAGTTNIPGATVRINEAVGQSDSNGAFGFHAKKAERYAISVSLFGYALVSQIEHKPNTSLRFTLKKAYVQELSPDDLAKGVTVADPRKTQIELPPNAFGKDVNEPVNASVYTYDLENEPMPGDLSIADSDGYLEPAGVFSAEFVGESGKKYSLAAGKEAAISMPASSVRDELPGLWYYDETTGKWVEGNSDSVNLVDGRLQGKVGHFSTWNFDWEKSNPACLKLELDAGKSLFGTSSSVKLRIKVVPASSYRGRRSPRRPFPDKTYLKTNSTTKFPLGLNNLPPGSTATVSVEESPGNWVVLNSVTVGPSYRSRPGGFFAAPYGMCTPVVLKGKPKAELFTDQGQTRAKITGKSKGLPFSWYLKSKTSPSPDSFNSSFLVPDNKPAKEFAEIFATDLRNKAGSGRGISYITYTKSFTFGSDNFDLYVGPPGINKPTSHNDALSKGMCKVELGSSCTFNPTIRLITRKQALTTLGGVVWLDANGDRRYSSDEKPYQGLTVTLSPGGRQAKTDEDGYYQFVNLSAGKYTVSADSSVAGTYTTSTTFQRFVGELSSKYAFPPRTANFGITDVFGLSISVGKGRGTVLVNGSEFCRSSCFDPYFAKVGSQLNLTVTPDSGYSFANWTGACATENPTTSVVMDTHKKCTANFTRIPSVPSRPTGGGVDGRSGGPTGGGVDGSTGGRTGTGTTGTGASGTGTNGTGTGGTGTSGTGTGGTGTGDTGTSGTGTSGTGTSGTGTGGTGTGGTGTSGTGTSGTGTSGTTGTGGTGTSGTGTSGTGTGGTGTGSNTGGTILDNVDGNGDGTEDGKQDNVVSISGLGTDKVKLTLQASNGCALKNVQIKRDASLSIPDGRTFSYGLVEFEAACAETQMTLFYHVNTTDKGCKFSPTSTNKSSEWYTLPSTTGKFVKAANQSAIKVSFNLKDGELGDNTGKDGKIVSISGLALTKPACAKVTTYAQNPATKECKEFATACVTEGWDVISSEAYQACNASGAGPTYKASGTILDKDGKGLKGVTVQVGDKTAVTDDKGEWKILFDLKVTIKK